MAVLAYQDTGYTGANVTHTAATDNTATETFNKANGALGPVLSWTRQVFTHANPFVVATNQCVLSASTVGLFEDAQLPAPTVTTPNITITLDITATTRTGTGNYLADVGAIIRYAPLGDGTDYRGYAFSFGRSNIVIPGVDFWHLWVFRVDNRANAQLLVADAEPLADVTPPAVLTITAQEHVLTATVTHAGTAPAMTITATDTTYTNGPTLLGGSVELAGTSTASITIDNFTMAGDDDVIQADTRGFLWIKNTDASSRTATVSIAGQTFQQANPDSAVAVPAGTERLVGPFPDEMAFRSGGVPLIAVNYSAFTGVSAAAVRVNTPPPDLP